MDHFLNGFLDELVKLGFGGAETTRADIPGHAAQVEGAVAANVPKKLVKATAVKSPVKPNETVAPTALSTPTLMQSVAKTEPV